MVKCTQLSLSYFWVSRLQCDQSQWSWKATFMRLGHWEPEGRDNLTAWIRESLQKLFNIFNKVTAWETLQLKLHAAIIALINIQLPYGEKIFKDSSTTRIEPHSFNILKRGLKAWEANLTFPKILYKIHNQKSFLLSLDYITCKIAGELGMTTSSPLAIIET